MFQFLTVELATETKIIVHLQKANQPKRLNFALKTQHKTGDFFENVCYTDESSFNFYGYVWKRKK